MLKHFGSKRLAFCRGERESITTDERMIRVMQTIMRFFFNHSAFSIVLLVAIIVWIEFYVRSGWARSLCVGVLLCFSGVVGVSFSSPEEEMRADFDNSYLRPIQGIINSLYISSTNNNINVLQIQMACLHSKFADSVKSVNGISELNTIIYRLMESAASERDRRP